MMAMFGERKGHTQNETGEETKKEKKKEKEIGWWIARGKVAWNRRGVSGQRFNTRPLTSTQNDMKLWWPQHVLTFPASLSHHGLQVQHEDLSPFGRKWDQIATSNLHHPALAPIYLPVV